MHVKTGRNAALIVLAWGMLWVMRWMWERGDDTGMAV
jgi:hypothetical protein